MPESPSPPTIQNYESIQRAYDFFNGELFQHTLPNVIITYQRQQKVMGYASIGRWVNTERIYVDELAVNPEYFAKFPLIEIFQTLCHEMAHIWQAHFGKPGRRGYHNKEWAQKMRSIGLPPSTTGVPGGDETGEFMMDYVLLEGPFHQACQVLANTGFTLPWFDRYPVFRMQTPILAYDVRGTAAELGPTFLPVRNRRGESRHLKQATSEAHTIFDPSTLNDFLSPDDDDNLSALISTKPPQKSGRIKYVCKSCHIQLWGKPNLNVVCGDCELPLKEVT